MYTNYVLPGYEHASDPLPIETNQTVSGSGPKSFSSPEQLEFIHSVFKWMSVGLLISGVIAYWVANSPKMTAVIYGGNFMFLFLLVLELVAVVYLAAYTKTMSSETASLVFLGYSALNGLTLSVIFLVFTFGSIIHVFVSTSALFGAMSLYGYMTKRDLTTIGHIAFMGLLGIIIVSVINLFFHDENTMSFFHMLVF